MELVPQADELRSVQAYLVVEMLNEQTFDFSQAKLKLKDGLRFSLRQDGGAINYLVEDEVCLLYTSPSPRDATLSRMPSSA